MWSRTQQTEIRRWVLPFLAALVAALVAILPGTTASASATVGAETRVGAFSVAGGVLVGPPEHIAAGQRLGNRVAGPDFVVATGVAAKGVTKTCKPGNSFTGDTLVLMADGSKKPIREVELGDQVVATDPITRIRGPREVVDLIRHSGLHTMVAVRLVEDTVIDATDRHSFWVESRGAWVDAIDLRPGDVVITADGDRLTVESVGISEQDLTAYNLTVEGIHTYHVGQSGVLVHNDGEDIDLNGKSYTVWRSGPYRIDIEARGGMKQMHFQEQISGTSSGRAPKYQYNPATGSFDGMPKSLQRELAKNHPSYKNGLARATDVFGRVIGACG